MDISNKIIKDIENTLSMSKKYKKKYLFSYSFKLNTLDVLPFINYKNEKDLRFFWQSPSENIGFFGLKAIWIKDFTSANAEFNIKNDLKSLFSKSVSISDNKGIGPKIFGGHSFLNETNYDDTWENFPRCRYFLTECLVSCINNNTWLTISTFIKPDSNQNLIYKKIIKQFNNFNQYISPNIYNNQELTISKIKEETNNNIWNDMINSVIKEINSGVVQKVVLSRLKELHIKEKINLFPILKKLIEDYPECTTFMFDFSGQSIFLGCSPERLIKVKNGILNTEALAGTSPRSNDNKLDQSFSDKLITSSKENKEHNFVVKQIEEKLKSILKEVKINRTPEVVKLANVQHLKTKISGVLNEKKHILDLVKKFHPTPAVAGTPTSKAIEIINKYEKIDRGWYSGPIGWFDSDGEGEFNVALRSALIKNQTIFIYAGCGIINDSIPQNEWDESELKMMPIITSLFGDKK